VPAARVGDARSMGEEGQHCRFTLSSGGTRAGGVAFRTAARSISECGDELRDAAVTLELNRWNGTVEPRVVLRALCPVEPGTCEVVGEPSDFWPSFEAALGGPEPMSPRHAPPEAAPALAPLDPARAAASRQAPRELRDRRGEGFAGVVGDLLSSGDSVLIVCADVARRRAGLERVLGPRGATLVSWSSLAADPALAQPFEHLVALDPPPAAAGEALLASAPGGGTAHQAWGEPEVAFALAAAQAELDLRPALTELYRALREPGESSGDDLQALLVGGGRYPRTPPHCARLVRVFAELGLVEYGERRCTVVQGARAELERSPTYIQCQEQLTLARRYLAAAMPAARRAA
jgi:single-stranded-DNA-specific exonuclease